MRRQIIVDANTKILRLGGRPPRVTATLLGIQLGLFLLYVFADGPTWIQQHVALSSGQALGMFELWQPFTALWIHLELRNLIVDLLALWVFGPALERWWGGRRFGVYYIITGAFGLALGMIFGMIWPAHVMSGSLGSTIAIALACFLLFPRHLVHLHRLIGLRVGHVAIAAGVFLILGSLLSAAWLDVIIEIGGGLCGLLFLNSPKRLIGRWRVSRTKKKLNVVGGRSSGDHRFTN